LQPIALLLPFFGVRRLSSSSSPGGVRYFFFPPVWVLDIDLPCCSDFLASCFSLSAPPPLSQPPSPPGPHLLRGCNKSSLQRGTFEFAVIDIGATLRRIVSAAFALLGSAANMERFKSPASSRGGSRVLGDKSLALAFFSLFFAMGLPPFSS